MLLYNVSHFRGSHSSDVRRGSYSSNYTLDIGICKYYEIKREGFL